MDSGHSTQKSRPFSRTAFCVIGICAALEGIYGGAYKKKFTLSDRWEPELELFAGGEGWTDGARSRAVFTALP